MLVNKSDKNKPTNHGYGNNFGICGKPEKLFSVKDHRVNAEPGIYSGFYYAPPLEARSAEGVH